MTWAEERRADRAAEREQDRLDAEHKERLERQRREEAEEKKRKKRQERRQKRGQRRAARRARWARISRWLNRNPVTLFVGYVMAAAVIPAVISQVAALNHTGVMLGLALLLASMLEGGAWAVTFMGKAAEDAGRPTWKYRLAAWVTAGAASAIQYWHWKAQLPEDPWVAGAFAMSSVFALYLWDLKTHGGSGPTKQERRERKARKAQEKRRKKRFPDVWARYEDILIARRHGTVDPEAAWAEAWADERGAPVSQDKTVMARRVDAVQEVEEVLAKAGRTPESLAVEALLLDLFPAHGKGEDGPGGTPVKAPTQGPKPGAPRAAKAQLDPQVPPTGRRGNPAGPPVRGRRRPGDTQPFSRAARTEAARTARKAQQNRGEN